MKRQVSVLIVVALALVALGQLAGRDGAWAAPGQSPERQSYPSMTPSRRPGAPTETRAPGPTQPPPVPSKTPAPAQPTHTPVAHTFTPTPVPPTPVPTLSPTVDAKDTVESSPSLTPTPSLPGVPTETETAAASPTYEATETMAPVPSATEPPQTGVPSEPGATRQPFELLVTLSAGTGAPADEGVLAALGRDWMLICGLGLLILALLIFILGYILGRRRGTG